jgi:hypothetical protein
MASLFSPNAPELALSTNNYGMTGTPNHIFVMNIGGTHSCPH